MSFLARTLQLILTTVAAPAQAAEAVLAIRYPRDIMWGAVMAVAALWVLAQWLFVGGLALSGEAGLPSPGTQFVIYASMLVILIFAFYLTGRVFGGEGTFPGAIITVAWVFFVILLYWPLAFLVAQTLPFASSAFGWLALIALAHTMVHFLNRLHGFDSLLTATTVLFAVVGGLAVAILAVLWAMGFTLQLERLYV